MRRALDRADAVVTSELAALEVERALIRNIVDGRLTETVVARLRVLTTRLMSGRSVVAITSEILASGRSRFPKEPVRALEAIDLATLLVTRASVPDLQVLSLDDRVRDDARLLGFTVWPP